MEGETKDLIEKANLGVVVKYGDKKKLKNIIRELYYKYKNRVAKNDFNECLISKYERKELTKRLTDIFESAIQRIKLR